MLVALRWPAAILAALAVAVVVLDSWWYVFAGCSLETGGTYLYCGIFRGQLWCNTFDQAVGQTIESKWRLERHGWRINAISLQDASGPAMVVDLGGPVSVPLWLLPVLPTALAVTGFVRKRRQHRPGTCKACRYPLQGALTCPECGKQVLAQ